ncbi:MAG: superoxide dismutase, Ni [Tissierellia bacterium]|nr:superoxide dismutase, Ni [Tissierellia bacterium]
MKWFEKVFHIEEVRAHCDIPCGIYDPMTAQIAALTTVRMMDQMKETLEGDGDTIEKRNKFARLVQVKEEHAEKAKHEIRVIWGDFIKPDHVEKYPDIHKLAHEIMMQGSKVKQGTNREDAVKFVELINEFAKIFWEIKGEDVLEKEAPYPPNLPLVYRKI